ncbi:hypothetical protein KCP73_15955 [Salmonella enterica subsp. enterica]|nr:hypothetical protein KCP73_15955 [Salmonella enterica subsp. enterica]
MSAWRSCGTRRIVTSVPDRRYFAGVVDSCRCRLVGIWGVRFRGTFKTLMNSDPILGGRCTYQVICVR